MKPPKLRRPRAIHPNAGLEAQYRARLDQVISAMSDSVKREVEKTYKKNEPVIAQDILPSDALMRVIKELAKRWQVKFDELAGKLAEYFATDAMDRSDYALKKMLRDAGFTVKFQMTAAMRDIFKATIHQNVSLIKSIPSQYFTQIEGMVQRSVQTGRDLGQLSKDLQAQYGVTKRRAALISRDQNNKATSAMTAARQQEAGITKGIWQHSTAGKEPRPTHVKMNGKKFDISKGFYDKDEGEWVMPGQLINCRCTWRPVILGFE